MDNENVTYVYIYTHTHARTDRHYTALKKNEARNISEKSIDYNLY